MILSDYRFSPAVRRTVRALVPVICPPEVEELGLVDAVVAQAELFVRSLAPEARYGLVAGYRSFELLAATRPAQLGRTFSALPKGAARAYFDAWWNSPLGPARSLAMGMKSPIAIGYYELPEVQARMGYAAQGWMDRVRQERRDRFGEVIARHEAELVAPNPLVSGRERR
ncbi:MAG: hypothetical protein IT371_19635 [Deltaproteobacteria bacterium]|nr:hypothetical protein [Deltaproteobacteria bacterium]